MNLNSTDISARGMLADLRVSQWTGRKTDKRVAREVAEQHQVAERQGTYYKSLIDGSALENVRLAVTAAREYHWKLTLPWSDTGPRILSGAAYFDYMQRMGELQQRFEQAV